ncbi:uncharacterized protein LOC121395643 [Xenopus laevis]|uniref:Uncharacterized protein LOC121395643 n=2 Tax=Xenopus laevis TaxID=8355 RepID=A0A1L8FP00_XENLA|nr:uncharacterized protein LOC121395643 [Xenopus laevis]OCT73281.1 hypothetical protein XELAEV_18036261mg [Xenopus laevis]
MVSFSILLLVLISSTATVYTHECVQCTGTSLTADAKTLDCTASKSKCLNHQDHCVTRYYDMKHINGKLIQGFIVRECGTMHDCFDTILFRNETVELSMSAQCCALDICEIKDPSFKNKTSKNPVSCKVCYDDGQGECNTNTTMKCTGEDSKCASISYKSTDANNKVAQQFFMRGCAQEKKCGNQTLTAKINNIAYEFHYYCDACASLRFSPVMLVLAALSFIKLI